MTRTRAETRATMLGRPSPSEDPLHVFPRALTKLYSLWVNLFYPFASLGRNLSVHYSCDWRRSQSHLIKIGNSVQIRKDAILDVSSDALDSREPVIIIDDETCVGPECHISARSLIHIERDVLVGQGVMITDHASNAKEAPVAGDREEPTSQGSVHIGQGTWIGYRAAILCTRGELVLGRNCVVGANAVVTRSFPPYSVIFGNPARVIRQFDPVKNKWVLKLA